MDGAHFRLPTEKSKFNLEEIKGSAKEASEKGRQKFIELKQQNPTEAVAVAAIQSLCWVVENSREGTMMGLQTELRATAERIVNTDPTCISLQAGCELFIRHVTLTSRDQETEDFEAVKRVIGERGDKFSQLSLRSRHRVATHGDKFIRDGMVVLTHGFSRVVVAVLTFAAQQGKQFSVIVTETRPDQAGYRTAAALNEVGIPTSLILDSAVGYHMERAVDMILLGAEGVVENGGIINKIGTFQVSMMAKTLKKPVYVAAESYKFTRLFPLNQHDLGEAMFSHKRFTSVDPHQDRFQQAPRECHSSSSSPSSSSVSLPQSVPTRNPQGDYTPPSYITLLFTDLGILTPEAVSDELIQLYQ